MQHLIFPVFFFFTIKIGALNFKQKKIFFQPTARVEKRGKEISKRYNLHFSIQQFSREFTKTHSAQQLILERKSKETQLRNNQICPHTIKKNCLNSSTWETPFDNVQLIYLQQSSPAESFPFFYHKWPKKQGSIGDRR